MYKLTKNGVIRLADATVIRESENNTDWGEYKKWILDGHTPEPADVPPVVYSITPEISLVAVGADVPLKITGAPNTTVEIDTGVTITDVVLDENGNGGDVFTAPAEGNYYLKFVDKTLSTLRVKIEAAD